MDKFWQKLGVQFNSETVEISNTQIVLVRNIQKLLTRQSDVIKAVNAVVDDIKVRFKTSQALQTFISPTTLKPDMINKGLPASQGSLLSILLRVPALQERLISFAFDMALLYQSEMSHGSSMLGDHSSPAIAPLTVQIIGQMRWLEDVTPSALKHLKSQLMVYLPKFNLTIQQELIIYLPDMFPDSAHNELSHFLLSMIDRNKALLSSCLDTFSKFVLPPNLLQRIHLKVTDMLTEGVDAFEFVSAAQFLVETSPPDRLSKAIEVIYCSSAFHNLIDYSVADESSSHNSSSDDIMNLDSVPSSVQREPKDHPLLKFLEILRTECLLNSKLASLWLKYIANSKENSAVEIFCLSMLGRFEELHKRCSQILKAKIKSGMFNFDALKTICEKSLVFSPYVDGFVKLLQALLSGTERVMEDRLTDIAVQIFRSFPSSRKPILQTLFNILSSDSSALSQSASILNSPIAKCSSETAKSMLEKLFKLDVECMIDCRDILGDFCTQMERLDAAGSDMFLKFFDFYRLRAVLDVSVMISQKNGQTKGLLESLVQSLAKTAKASKHAAGTAALLVMEGLKKCSKGGNISFKIVVVIFEQLIVLFNDSPSYFQLLSGILIEYIAASGTSILSDSVRAQVVDWLVSEFRERLVVKADDAEAFFACDLVEHSAKNGAMLKVTAQTFSWVYLLARFDMTQALKYALIPLALPAEMQSLFTDVLQLIENMEGSCNAKGEFANAQIDQLFQASVLLRQLINVFSEHVSPTDLFEMLEKLLVVETMLLCALSSMDDSIGLSRPTLQVMRLVQKQLKMKPAKRKGGLAKSTGAKKRRLSPVAASGAPKPGNAADAVQESDEENEPPTMQTAADPPRASVASAIQFLTIRGSVFAASPVPRLTAAITKVFRALKNVDLTSTDMLVYHLCLDSVVQVISASAAEATHLLAVQDHLAKFWQLLMAALAKRDLFAASLTQDSLTQSASPVHRFSQQLLEKFLSVMNGLCNSSVSKQEKHTFVNVVWGTNSIRPPARLDVAYSGLCEKLMNSYHTWATATSLVKLLECVREADDRSLDELRMFERDFIVGLFADERLAGKGAQSARELYWLVGAALECSGWPDDRLARLDAFCGQVVEGLMTSTQQPGQFSLKVCQLHFGIFYEVMLKELAACCKAVKPPDQPVGAAAEPFLLHWNAVAKRFYCMLKFLQQFDTKDVLSSSLKHGRVILESFIDDLMPVLDALFTRRRQDVQNLIKNFQLCTRTLQNICAHSKVTGDGVLAGQVPTMKRILERFLFRVKAMLSANKCVEAFWVGNLKNRNLKGEVIPSQEVVESDDTDSNSSSAESPPPSARAKAKTPPSALKASQPTQAAKTTTPRTTRKSQPRSAERSQPSARGRRRGAKK